MAVILPGPTDSSAPRPMPVPAERKGLLRREPRLEQPAHARLLPQQV